MLNVTLQNWRRLNVIGFVTVFCYDGSAK